MKSKTRSRKSRSRHSLHGVVSHRLTWRCFHCNEVFRSKKRAQEHFGGNLCDTPACKIDAAALRELEKQLALYRAEDTDLHRQIRSMECKHQTALMRAEESGYTKGLRDGRTLDADTPDDVALRIKNARGECGKLHALAG